MATEFKIREIWSPDLGKDSAPSDPSSFQGLFKFRLESADGKNHANFKFLVFTTSELAKVPAPIWGNGILILDEFSWGVLRPQLEFRLGHIRNSNWTSIIESAMRHFQLEDEFWNDQDDA